jgi:hypothetical protein
MAVYFYDSDLIGGPQSHPYGHVRLLSREEHYHSSSCSPPILGPGGPGVSLLQWWVLKGRSKAMAMPSLGAKKIPLRGNRR